MVKTDVFFCTSGVGREPPEWLILLRKMMADLCMARWNMEEAYVRVVTPDIVRAAGYNEPFQKSRRQYAEDVSSSNIYCVVDDDILLGSMPVVGPIVDIMEREPSVGILALHLQGAKRHTVGPYLTPELEQCHAVGGCRFIRKGMDLDWPPMARGNPYQYDVPHGMAVEAAGYISAYTLPRTITGMHLGSGYSMTWLGERHVKRPPVPQQVVRCVVP